MKRSEFGHSECGYCLVKYIEVALNHRLQGAGSAPQSGVLQMNESNPHLSIRDARELDVLESGLVSPRAVTSLRSLRRRLEWR